MLYRVWRFGGGDWLEPFRVFNDLGADLRPVGRPDAKPLRPRMPAYRHFMYGCGKYAAEVEEGFQESNAPRTLRVTSKG